MASEQLQAIIQVLRSRPVQEGLTFEEMRANFEQRTSFFQVPADVRCERVDAGGVPGEWIMTPQATAEETARRVISLARQVAQHPWRRRVRHYSPGGTG
jgi:hypothetical protein